MPTLNKKKDITFFPLINTRTKKADQHVTLLFFFLDHLRAAHDLFGLFFDFVLLLAVSFLQDFAGMQKKASWHRMQ